MIDAPFGRFGSTDKPLISQSFRIRTWRMALLPSMPT
jgi:hypothetical protein